MQNPYLIQNLQSQGLHYLLVNSEEEKKALSSAPKKNPNPKTFASLSNSVNSTNSSPKISQQNTAALSQTIQSPAEQFKTNTEQKPNPHKAKFSLLQAKQEKKVKKEQEQSLSAFDKNPLKQPILPYNRWSGSWKQIQRHCKFSSEKPTHLSRQIIWTYAGLEYDLFTDNPSAERRQLISQIIKTLALPKGTHIFLPYRLINSKGESEIAKEQEYSFFWSAIDLIRPRVLVVFGEQTISELDLPPLLPTQKHTLMPVTIYALDNIMLYTENESENTIMMNFLSANLKIFA